MAGFPFRTMLIGTAIGRRVHALVVGAALSAAAVPALAAEPLKLYFIDVEGGQSTLIVTPAHQSLLVDAGFPGAGGWDATIGDPARARDANRIVAAMKDAGVDRIDYLWVTHFHRDHTGGIAELAQIVNIGTFVDHGGPSAGADPVDVEVHAATSAARARARHVQPKPGDLLPLKDVEVRVVSADRATLSRPLSGAGGRNAACGPAAMPSADSSHQNPRSNGFVLTLGRFRFLDLGDLSDQPLYDLVCPTNRIGAVDVYLVAHHGGNDVADAATLAAFQPRVAIVDNGPQKGGGAKTLQLLKSASGTDTWQLHVGEGGAEVNAPADRIANLDESTAHWLKLTARPDGTFRIDNPRTRSGKEYR